MVSSVFVILAIYVVVTLAQDPPREPKRPESLGQVYEFNIYSCNEGDTECLKVVSQDPVYTVDGKERAQCSKNVTCGKDCAEIFLYKGVDNDAKKVKKLDDWSEFEVDGEIMFGGTLGNDKPDKADYDKTAIHVQLKKDMFVEWVKFPAACTQRRGVRGVKFVEQGKDPNDWTVLTYVLEEDGDEEEFMEFPRGQDSYINFKPPGYISAFRLLPGYQNPKSGKWRWPGKWCFQVIGCTGDQ